jgi:nucleotide-binding universal stress UspA family protein
MDLYVSAFVELLRAEGIAAEGFTNIGRSGLSIAAEAERLGASLIIVTARSRTQVEDLLDATPIPVWVAPPQTPMTIGPILVPIERNAASQAVLPRAVALARSMRTRIVLFQAVDTRLVPAREIEKHEVVEPEIVVRQGDAVLEILRASRELGIGIIVAWDGPVARGLLGLAPVPLLIDKPTAPSQREGAPVRISEKVLAPVDLWTRRIPANPLQGLGRLGD